MHIITPFGSVFKWKGEQRAHLSTYGLNKFMKNAKCTVFHACVQCSVNGINGINGISYRSNYEALVFST